VFDLVNLTLAVIGTWSIMYSLLRWLASRGLGVQTQVAAGVAALLIGIGLTWARLTRRPQDVFRVAAATEDRTDELRRIMALGMRSETAYECLTAVYRPIVHRIAEQCAGARAELPTDATGQQCLVLTLAVDSPGDVDGVVVGNGPERDPSWLRRVSEFAPERQMFMATMRRNVYQQNRFGDDAGMNVVLDAIACDSLQLTVATATYGQIVRTSDSLISEFALFGHISGRSAIRRRPRPLRFAGTDVLKVMPWRREVHSWDQGTDLLLAPRGRAAGIGVSVALVSRDAARTSAFVARRSSSVGTYPDVLHVIPSGMINVHDDRGQPNGSALAALPRLTMMAEFLEECFDVEELSGHSVGNYALLVNRQIAARGLGELKPRLTGLAIDLLNLRTEICAVLDLGPHSAIADEFRLSWEYTHNERLRTIDLSAGFPDVEPFCLIEPGYIVNIAIDLAVHVESAATPGSVDRFTHRLISAIAGRLDLPGLPLLVSTPNLPHGRGLGSSGALSVAIAYGGAGLVRRHTGIGSRRSIEADLADLASRMTLVHSGRVRDSGSIITAVAGERPRRAMTIVREMSAIALSTLSVLAASDVAGLASCMNESAQLLSALHPLIVDDAMRRTLHSLGAVAAKPCGAGGPGAVWVVLTDPDQRDPFRDSARDLGLRVVRAQPNSHGMTRAHVP